MNDKIIKEAKKELRQLCDKMDELIGPVIPAEHKQRKSLQNQFQRSSELTNDTVDGFLHDSEKWFERPERDEYFEEFEDVFVRFTILYQMAGNLPMTVATGESFLAFYDDLNEAFSDWYIGLKKYKEDDIRKLKAVDCFIDAFVEVDNDSIDDGQIETLHNVSDALLTQSLPAGKLRVDHLKRQLNACIAILTVNNDETIKERYVESYFKLMREADSDDETLSKYTQYAEDIIEQTGTLEQKLEWTWMLYDVYAKNDEERKTAILKQYAEWCFENPDVEIDPNRRFIAYKTMAYLMKKARPAMAQEYDTAAKAILGELMANFELETDSKGDEFKAGFKYKGRFTGLVWQKSYGSSGGNSCGSFIGIADKDGLLWHDLGKNNVTTEILDWVPEYLSHDAFPKYHGSSKGTTPVFLVRSNNVPSMLRVIKEEKEDRCIFCGMHCNGILNGLGSQFYYYKNLRLAELQGLWQDGKLTHVRSGGRLIPLDGEMSKEDSRDFIKIYKNIADNADTEDSEAYYKKVIELEEKIKDENTGKDEYLLLAHCYKALEEKKEDYVALLNEIMDRFGNDAKLAKELFIYLDERNDLRVSQAFDRYMASESGHPDLDWDFYTYLDGKNDPRTVPILERFLDCKGGDPEKRAKAATLLKKDDIAKEAYLNTFGNLHWSNHYTRSGGDFDCYAELDVWGFIADDKMTGYAWSMEGSEGPMEDCSWYRCCGVLKDEYEYDYEYECRVPKFACWIPYRFGRDKIKLCGEVPPEVLVESDDQGRITFFGMQKDGKRHGLGTEFIWKDGKIDNVFRGYWEEGKLTHEMEGSKLKPIH